MSGLSDLPPSTIPLPKRRMMVGQVPPPAGGPAHVAID